MVIKRTVFLTLLLSAPLRVSADEASNAAVLHARALLAEDDGDVSQALSLLREAVGVEPTNELIAFDLARLALEGKHAEAKDLEPLIGMELHFEASRRLKVYALLATGRGQEASNALAMAHFDADEAKELRQLLAEADNAKSLMADARFGAERDTNVTLLPDSEGARDAGTRLVLDTTLGWQPTKTLELGLVAQLARHLNDRDVLADYDYGIASGIASVSDDVGPLRLTGDFAGTLVTTSLLSEVFSTEGAGRFDVQLADVPLTPGIYARGAVRNYVVGNLETSPFDRDANLYGGGAVSEARIGRVSYLVRGGYIAEAAQGLEQRQRGVEANAYGNARLGDFELSAALGFTRRWYYTSSTDRRDTRFSPSFDVTYAFAKHFSASLGYAFTHNGSTADNFRYVRHIVRLTLSGAL